MVFHAQKNHKSLPHTYKLDAYHGFSEICSKLYLNKEESIYLDIVFCKSQKNHDKRPTYRCGGEIYGFSEHEKP